MSCTTSWGDHGSVVTVSRIVDADTVGVIAPPPGELFPKTNNNSVAILPRATARCASGQAGDAEAGEEDYMAEGSYINPLTVINV